MKNNLEEIILKRLDQMNFKSSTIAEIMGKLDNNEKQRKFFKFIVSYNSEVLSLQDIFKELNTLESCC